VKVVTVLGTRPEAIKLAPVLRELERRPDATSVVVSSGQHEEMLVQMLDLFEIVPDVELAVMRPGQRLCDLTARLVRTLSATLRRLEPDWVVVQGDTTTAFCGALAAFYQDVPVAHVEAGLRSHDLRAPFPEEANRRLAGALTQLHLCPTSRAADNLLREGVPSHRIQVTGNTVVDALLWAAPRAAALPPVLERERPRRILVTLHRRESHGAVMEQICKVIALLAERGDVEIVFPVHPNPAVEGVVLETLSGVAGVHLCEPLDYISFVQVLADCDLVLTDSGGIQEEAPTFGKPVLVLRDTTERPEAIEAGVARLVGTEPAAVFGAAAELLDDPDAYAAMARAQSPFGDGAAAERVVAGLAEGHVLASAAA
jgi:UDP-N-acetylglucosamine 2-epimerase (non-hydrolysing)